MEEHIIFRLLDKTQTPPIEVHEEYYALSASEKLTMLQIMKGWIICEVDRLLDCSKNN